MSRAPSTLEEMMITGIHDAKLEEQKGARRGFGTKVQLWPTR